LQYNNTLVVANSSTVHVPDATSIYGTHSPINAVPTWPGLPTTLLDGWSYYGGGDYAATALEPGTEVSAGGVVFYSPTAYTYGFLNVFVTWAQYSNGVSVTGGGQDAGSTFASDNNPLTSAYPATEAYPTYSGTIITTLPAAVLSAITGPGQSFYAISTNVPMSSCSGAWSMSGEPTGMQGPSSLYDR